MSMKRSLLMICVGLFALSYAQLECSDDTDYAMVAGFAQVAGLPRREIGALTVDEIISRTMQESAVTSAQLRKLDEILTRAAKRKAVLQLKEQDMLEELQKLDSIKKDYDAAKLLRLQKALEIVKSKEQNLAAEIEKIAPGTVTTAATDAVAEPAKIVEASFKPEATSAVAPSSSWLWKLVPFAS